MSLETYENWLDEHGELPFGMPTWDTVGKEAHLVREARCGWSVEDPWAQAHACFNYVALAILQQWHRERLWEDHRILLRADALGDRWWTVHKYNRVGTMEMLWWGDDGQWHLHTEIHPNIFPRRFDDYDAALLAAAGAVKKGDSDADAT